MRDQPRALRAWVSLLPRRHPDCDGIVTTESVSSSGSTSCEENFHYQSSGKNYVGMTCGSLFSGIGGLDLGLERAGMSVIWQSEIKPHAAAVLARHWPNVPNLGDIRTVEWSTVERPTVLCGGFPCQDLSHAHTASANGARAGLDGPASGLWRYFAQAVEQLEPEWVIVENVETWRSWVPDVRADLARHGYASVPIQLSAGSFGAPHIRPRCFVVAHANGDSEPLLAIYEEVAALRPVSRRDSRDWRNAPSRHLLLDDGLPDRVGQNDAYGNAVVPPVAEWLGRQIIAASVPSEAVA